MKKKVLSIVLAAALGATLIGCTSAQPQEAPAFSEPE